MQLLRFLLETLLKAAPRLLPLFVIFAIPEYKVWFGLVYLVVLGASEYYSVYRPEKRLRERTKKIFDSHFRPWLPRVRYRKGKPSLRVNIMLLSPWRVRLCYWLAKKNQQLNESGINLRLFCIRLPLAPDWLVRMMKPRFTQVYEFGMSGHQDANLGLPLDSGFCGECFRLLRKGTFYKDMRGLDPVSVKREHKLSDEEYERTKHITAITCTTLMRKTKRIFGRELPEEEYFGVLNIDATDDRGATFLKREEVLRQIEAFGVIVEEILT